MEFVVTTHSHAVRVQIGPDGSLKEHEILATGYHYGATVLRGPDGAAGGLILYRGGDNVSQQTRPELHRYARTPSGFTLQSRTPAPGSGDVHQIVHDGEGLFLADTKHNTLRYLPDTGEPVTYAHAGVEWDANHLNSVYPCGDQVFVLLHNLKQRESQVAVLHFRDGRLEPGPLLSLWDRNCHNVFADERELIYNASLTTDLVFVDVQADALAARVPLAPYAASYPTGRGHVKGLSISEGKLVVGISEEAERSRRGISQSGLIVLDRASREIEATVDLHLPGQEHPIGNINEVRRLDAPDLAERRAAPVDVDWSRLKLARRNPLPFLMERIKGRVIGPLVRLKRRRSVGQV